jgi:chromosome segregation ATPase
LNDAAEKKQMNALLDAFSRIAAKHVHLVKTHAVGNQGDPGAAAKQASAELEELKEILVQKEQKIQELQSGGDKAAALQEKDNIIATLQNRLQQASASQPRTDAGAAEWKDKYEKMRIANERLKETNDKYASQANELKSAYKEVVDDNRRLINQLQSARGGKN